MQLSNQIEEFKHMIAGTYHKLLEASEKKLQKLKLFHQSNLGLDFLNFESSQIYCYLTLYPKWCLHMMYVDPPKIL